MFVAGFSGGGDAGREDLLGFSGAGFAGEELGVHQVGGDVRGIALEERLEMLDGGSGIAGVHAFHGQAIAGESVIWFFRNEIFQQLAAGFLLFSHWVVSYYTGSPSGVQPRAGARGSNEAEGKKE